MQVHFHQIDGHDLHSRLLYCGRVINRAMQAKMKSNVVIAAPFHEQLKATLWHATADAFIPSDADGVVKIIESASQIDAPCVIDFSEQVIEQTGIEKLFMIVNQQDSVLVPHRTLYQRYKTMGFQPEFLSVK